MADIVLTAKPVADRVASGEPLLIGIYVENQGTVPLRVHDPIGVPPFDYELRSSDGQGRLLVLSEALRPVLLGWTATATAPSTMRDIQPGAGVHFEHDLNKLVPEAIPPGRYELATRYALDGTTYQAPPRTVEVVGLTVSALSAVHDDALDSLIFAYARPREGGGLQIVERTASGGTPDAAFPELRAESALSSVLGLAQTVAVVPRDTTRWLAWLEGDQLRAQLSWGTSTILESEPVPVPLARPGLLERACQLSDGQAVIFVVGAQNEGALARPLVLSRQPPRWLADVPLGSADPELCTLRVLRAQPDQAVQLFWVAATRLCMTRVPLEPPGTEPPRVLFESELPFRALGVAASTLQPNQPVDALLGPDADERLHHARIDPGGTVTERWTFPLPPGTSVTDVRGWVLPPEATEAAPSAVLTNGALWLRDSAGAGGQWRTVATFEGPVGRPALWRLEDAHLGHTWWASWVEPGVGLRFLRVG